MTPLPDETDSNSPSDPAPGEDDARDEPRSKSETSAIFIKEVAILAMGIAVGLFWYGYSTGFAGDIQAQAQAHLIILLIIIILCLTRFIFLMWLK